MAFGLRTMSLWRRREPARPADPGSAEMVPPPAGSRVWPLPDLLDLLPHPIVAFGRDGSLVHANLAARLQFGDILAALLRHPLLSQAIRRLPPAETGSVDLAMDVPVRRLLRVALRSDAAELVLLSLTDRTEQEAVERMRVDFIANASHELRTPLASLIGFIETLQGPAADDAPARVRFLAIMAGQAARMRRLIDNLLSLSRIQMHEHQRPEGCISPGTLLRRVADEHEPQRAAADATLELAIANDLPRISADPDQLVQVLHNLLDNAIKYAGRSSRPARIVLAAHPARAGHDPAPDGVVLSVTDDGPGISPQHLPRLTERFYRVDDGNGVKPGSGLGLAIVKHIVCRHGGRLTIESGAGEGTRVAVWLPAAPLLRG